MKKLERWARSNKKSEALDFLSGLPRHIVFKRPTLIGSLNGHDRSVEGFGSSTRIIKEYFSLDDEYSAIEGAPSLTLMLSKRNDPEMSSKIMRSIQIGMGIRTPKICLAEHLGDCNGPVVAAHTVPLSELKHFTTSKNHVYGYLMNGKTDKRGFMIPQEIGRRIATTFTGICNSHDTKLFYPIEGELFIASNKQLFLFHYRSLLFEYYRRNFTVQKLQRSYDEMSRQGYAEDTQSIKHILNNNEIDRLEINTLKSACDKMLQIEGYNSVFVHAWTSELPPPIVGTLTFGPHKDLHGRRIQRPSSRSNLDWISLTITISSGKTLVVVGANSETPSAKAFVDSINALSPNERMQQLIGYTLCVMENVILLPWWWEQLDARCKEAVISTYHARVFPRKLPRLGEWLLESVSAK